MKKSRLMMVMAFLLASSCLAGFTPTIPPKPHHNRFIIRSEELYTVAINSFFATGTESYIDPESRVLEEDDYGRVLFIYSEDKSSNIYTMLISQHKGDGYVYFYRHYNFMPQKARRHSYVTEEYEEKFTSAQRAEIYSPPYLDDRMLVMINEKGEPYTVAEVDEFKRLNDWNEPLALDKAAKVRATTDRRYRGPIDDKSLRDAMQLVFGGELSAERIIPLISRYLTFDYFGRSIYHAWDKGGRHYVLLFQADGSFDPERGFMYLVDRQRHRDGLEEFLERNGWDESPDFTPSWPGWPPGAVWTRRESEGGDSYRIERYDARGNRLVSARYDSRGVIDYVKKYDTSGKMRVETKYRPGDDNEILYIREYNDLRFMVKEIRYLPGGKIADIRKYNNRGFMVKKTEYWPGGGILRISEYNDDGKIISSIDYAEDGSIEYSHIYEYDADGN